MTHRILPSMLLLACAAEGAEVGVDDLHATFAIDGRDAGYHARWVGRDGDQVVVDALTVMRLGDADLRMAFQIRLDRTAPGGWRSFWYDDGERMTEAGWSDDGCVAGVDGDVAPFAAAADSIPTWAYFLPLARLERRAGAEVAYTRLHESLDAREPARLVCDRREATGWEVRLLVDGQEASAFRIDDGGGLLRAHWNGPVSERVAGWAELVPRLPEEVRAAEADYDAAVDALLTGDERDCARIAADLALMTPNARVAHRLTAALRLQRLGPRRMAAAAQALGGWRFLPARAPLAELGAAAAARGEPADAMLTLGLARLGQPGLDDELLRLARESDDPFIQGDAIWALSRRGPTNAAPAIRAVGVDAGVSLISGEAVAALGRLRDQQAAPPLRAWLHGPEANTVAYLWTDGRGTRNGERPLWQVIDQALGRIHAVDGARASLAEARAAWPR